MEVKKVLWPTDFSKNADKALPYVTSLSEKYQTEVHVLYVIEDLGHHEPWYGEFDVTHIEKIHDWEHKAAEKKLDQICQKYLSGCPLFIRHVAVGDPAGEILKTITNENIDMVVMASHGRKGQFQFGGVAEKVVKNAKIPVVTIPIG
jgi:nucleotide-binding universal stress UspA family protein